MTDLLSDLRGVWRLMRRARGTCVLILLTLALGLGANVAIFAVARGVLLRPLPYEDPDRLVMVWWRRDPLAPGSMGRGLSTPRFFREINARQRSFSSIAAVELWDGNPSATFDIATSGGGERLRGAFATPNIFSTIGVTPIVGRAFSADDADDVAVISHALWHSLFGRKPDVIGQRLELATGRGTARAFRPLTIIGVLPPGVEFSYPESTDVWLPLSAAHLEKAPLDAIVYRIVARLRPGVTLQHAHRDLAAAKIAIAVDSKRDMNAVTFWAEPAHDYAVGAFRPAMRLLTGVAVLVFIVACLNVTALLLAQAAERRRAFAVQLALGATRWRLTRQLLTESCALATGACFVSVAVVAALQPLLRTTLPPGIPRTEDIGIDLITVAWSTVLIATAVIASTIVPAWRASALQPGVELGHSNRSLTHSRRSAAWRHALTASQVAIVVVQLVGGCLLLHSFGNCSRSSLDSTANGSSLRRCGCLGPSTLTMPGSKLFRGNSSHACGKSPVSSARASRPLCPFAASIGRAC